MARRYEQMVVGRKNKNDTEKNTNLVQSHFSRAVRGMNAFHLGLFFSCMTQFSTTEFLRSAIVSPAKFFFGGGGGGGFLKVWSIFSRFTKMTLNDVEMTSAMLSFEDHKLFPNIL